jgi:methylated-DNA-protein-cysteine methyltransferase-like protein
VESFTEKVYSVVRQVPKGRVTTYGAIAKHIGTGLSSRMVGWALNSCHNVFPPVPAHRVVNRNGLLTGKQHFATQTLMQEMLENEGVTVIEDEVQDFKEKLWVPESLNPDL